MGNGHDNKEGIESEKMKGNNGNNNNDVRETQDGLEEESVNEEWKEEDNYGNDKCAGELMKMDTGDWEGKNMGREFGAEEKTGQATNQKLIETRMKDVKEARRKEEEAARKKAETTRARQEVRLKAEKAACQKVLEAKAEAVRQKALEKARPRVMTKVEEAASQKRRRVERAKESRKIGKDRVEGRTKGPDWQDDELVAEIWARTCNMKDLHCTMDGVGIGWLDGGTFFHFYVGD